MYNTLKYIFITLILVLLTGCSEWFGKNVKSYDSYNTGKYELSISLEKEQYKVFEPIVAEFTLINHDTLPLKIKSLFNTDNYISGKLIFKDKNNNDVLVGFNHYEIGCGLLINDTVNAYELNLNDTLHFAMKINNWGKKLSPYNDKQFILFSNYGYFKPGLYRFYYIQPVRFVYDVISNLKPLYRSNEVKFSVEENDIEESFLLKQIKMNEFKVDMIKFYEDLIRKYPQNEFREHFYYEYLMYKHAGLQETDTLVEDYEKFISEYPNSSYLMEDRFINPYIFYLCKDFNNTSDASVFLRTRLTNAKILKFVSHPKRLYNIVVHKWH